jgi:hypothetical protein
MNARRRKKAWDKAVAGRPLTPKERDEVNRRMIRFVRVDFPRIYGETIKGVVAAFESIAKVISDSIPTIQETFRLVGRSMLLLQDRMWVLQNQAIYEWGDRLDA